MAKASIPIRFHNADLIYRLENATALKSFIHKKIKAAGKKAEVINYIFCSDAYLLELNQVHLKHDTLTDIITFELSGPNDPLISDIYISIERVKENAQIFSTTIKAELHRVIFHGALHLLGYKDKSAKDAQLMRSMENEWLKEYRIH